ncbi:hypothetical protein Z947_1779 [Sulfitobacter geojensis]|nr:hypothetical protein Z947_1779 [Sulfitobacter geojensis]
MTQGKHRDSWRGILSMNTVTGPKEVKSIISIPLCVGGAGGEADAPLKNEARPGRVVTATPDCPLCLSEF